MVRYFESCTQQHQHEQQVHISRRARNLARELYTTHMSMTAPLHADLRRNRPPVKVGHRPTLDPKRSTPTKTPAREALSRAVVRLCCRAPRNLDPGISGDALSVFPRSKQSLCQGVGSGEEKTISRCSANFPPRRPCRTRISASLRDVGVFPCSRVGWLWRSRCFWAGTFW